MRGILAILLCCLPVRAAIEFDGVDDFLTNSTFTVALNSDITIALWVFVTEQSRQQFLVDVDNVANPSHCILQIFSDNVLYFDYGDATGAGRISHSFANLFNAWTHIAVVSDGNSGAFRGIYTNGVLATSQASSDGPNVQLTTITVGNGGGLNDKPLSGRIADLGIWSAQLTAAEIKMLASSRLHRLALTVRPSALLGYWPMDDGAHGTSADGDSLADMAIGFPLSGVDGANNTGLSWQAAPLTIP